MANTRDEVFIQQQPRVATADLKNAAKADRIVASWNSHPAVDKNRQIMLLGIKFAFTNGKNETILIDRYAAHMLKMLLDALEKADWVVDHIAPIGKKPH